MSKFQKILSDKNVTPVDDFIHPVDDSMYFERAGDFVIVRCKVHRDLNDVLNFVENKTQYSRWIIAYGFPKEINGGWEWRLV